ncbi:pirin-like C-terminal cupin domain-containing protein [Spirillospora sp. NPDC048823]|uniref:pirin-like C-terminal cupin domain-containing protein n=1 Tax=unclassified Spirillospora TaxID=2642701 RepID=UPI0037134C32
MSTRWCTCSPGAGRRAPRRPGWTKGSSGSSPAPTHKGTGDGLVVRAADSQPVASANGWEILILGGLPIREPIARYGPFVMNTREEIVQAFEDFQAGRMGTIPAEKVPHRSDADESLA